jgi:hypothetical protein
MKRTVEQVFNDYESILQDTMSDPATLEFNKRGLLLLDIIQAYLRGDISRDEFIEARNRAYNLFDQSYELLMDFMIEYRNLRYVANSVSQYNDNQEIEKENIKIALTNMELI